MNTFREVTFGLYSNDACDVHFKDFAEVLACNYISDLSALPWVKGFCVEINVPTWRNEEYANLLYVISKKGARHIVGQFRTNDYLPTKSTKRIKVENNYECAK